MKYLLAAFLLACGLIYGFGDGRFVGERADRMLQALGVASNEEAPQDRYITAGLEVGEVRRTVTVTGTLNPTVNVDVGSQLSGQVGEVLVDFNDLVTKGEPLAVLDQKSFKARVVEAEASLDMANVAIDVARARLERASVDMRDSEAQRAVLKARTDNAQVLLDAAETELNRKQSLHDRQIGTVVELEDSRTKAAAAQAALREAEAIQAVQENAVAGAKVDVQRAQSELEAARASVPERRALLQLAQIDLERTTIRSPIDGVVVGRKVNEGQTLATALEAKTLFTIAGDLHSMEIHAMVDEADIGAMQAGQDADFTVDAYPGRHFPAKVRQLRKSPEVKQNVVTYTVVLTAENRDDLLLPGMTALVRITVSRTGPVLKIPLAALRFTPREAGLRAEEREVPLGRPTPIWVSRPNGEPKQIMVGVGEDDGTDAAVLSGSVRPDDRVVIGELSERAPRRLFGIRIGL